eukprot:gene913-218_t
MDERQETHYEDTNENVLIATWLARMLLWIQAKLLPASWHKLNAYFSQEKIDERYALVVCPSETCHAVYNFSESFDTKDGLKISKKCSCKWFKKTCQENLLYVKVLSNERTVLLPYKIYLFKPPSKWLEEMFQAKKFRNFIQDTHTNYTSDDNLDDICNGKVWKHFQKDPCNKTPLLEKKSTIAFLLHVDWVKAFKRGQHSVGTIFLTVLNIPRDKRNLKRWVNLVGIIPGPREPSVDINTYLRPIVDDLLLLYNGVDIYVKETKETINVKAILLCISCNIPAMRKVTQFLSHKANKGCSMCNFQAERDNSSAAGKMSYLTNNFVFNMRTNNEVRQHAEEYKNAKNKSQANEIAKRNGVRCSELLRLPYLDLATMCAVDPMHNLLLGLVHKEFSLIVNSENEWYTVTAANKERIQAESSSLWKGKLLTFREAITIPFRIPSHPSPQLLEGSCAESHRYYLIHYA